MKKQYELSLTTQGPLYPPSEVMDEDGNFIVIGALNKITTDGKITSDWGCAIVSAQSPVPSFGERLPYTVIEEFNEDVPDHIANKVLHTLPLPLPCANYPMLFAPEQYPDANTLERPSYAFHEVPIPDSRVEDGRRLTAPVRLNDWMTAKGTLVVSMDASNRNATFGFEFEGLIPHSLYTVMALRARDLDPAGPTRPGPLGIPNVFVTDGAGRARFEAEMPNPFPDPNSPKANRIVNVVVLWMSDQMNHGGAIGRFGLGGDIHAQLKLPTLAFQEFTTHN